MNNSRLLYRKLFNWRNYKVTDSWWVANSAKNSSWLGANNFRRGSPKATEKYSVEDLQALGIEGLYHVDCK
ncbi:MAG: hypothetical protein HC836_31255 [Richelia sp. RM2_1_2]|nr:hypothetical protein [Richelia sp. RM2_1_2]